MHSLTNRQERNLTTSNAHSELRIPRWLMVLAMSLVMVVVLSSFALSFTVLSDLAALSGIPSAVAWLWPVIVDGTIMAATLVLYTMRGRGRSQRMPMATLIIFGLASVVGNVAHILMVDPSKVVPAAIAVFVGVVPPVGLILTVEILGGLMRSGPPPEQGVDEPDDALFATGGEGATALVATTTVEPEPEQEALVVDNPAGGLPHHPELASPAPVMAKAIATTQPEAIMSAADTVDALPPEPVVTEPEPVVTDEPQGGESYSPVEETTEAVAPVTPLHAVESVPVAPEQQIDWIVAKAREGVDFSSWKTLSQMFEEGGVQLADRTIQRRLATARKQSPEAFAA